MGIEAAQGSRLASVLPTDTSNTTAFTATLDTEVTRMFVTNLSAGALTFRVFHVPADVVLGNVHALYYDHALAANDTFELFSDATNSGVQLKEGDTIVVRSSSGNNIAFNLYGVTASIAPGAGS
jgi:hypothetical protein